MSHDHDDDMSDEGLGAILAAVLGGHGCPHEQQLRSLMEVLGCLVHAQGGKIEVDMTTLPQLTRKGLGVYLNKDDPTKVTIELEDLPEGKDVPEMGEPVFVHATPRGVQ